MLLMKIFIVPSLVRFRASAQCRSVSADSSFGFRLFSSGLSKRNPEDPVTDDFPSEESLSSEWPNSRNFGCLNYKIVPHARLLFQHT